MKIWIDADACPKMIKEVLYKVSGRLKIPLCLVANTYLTLPLSPLITQIKVDKGTDLADMYIAENIEQGDLVITADIPLASAVIQKKVVAINPRGEIYTEDNISEILSMRNFMTELRDNGISTSGPSPLGPKDKEKFTNALDKLLTQMLS